MKQRGAPGRAERFLVEINAMRALYPYSSRSITLDSSTNIYLAHQQDNLVGFCEVLLKNTDISNPRPVFLSLTELHGKRRESTGASPEIQVPCQVSSRWYTHDFYFGLSAGLVTLAVNTKQHMVLTATPNRPVRWNRKGEPEQTMS
jgi:hypothetical protein